MAAKKDWKEYLLWALALLVTGGAAAYIYKEEKKKRAAALPPAPRPTTPTQQPIPPPPPPPATLPTTPPFGSGGTQVVYTQPDFDALIHQATTPQTQAAPNPVVVYTINTTNDPLRAHTLPDISAPLSGSFARGSQVHAVGEPIVTSADGRHWMHVMGQDAQTGVPLLGWVDSSYLLSIGG